MLSAAEKNLLRYIVGFWLISTKTSFLEINDCPRKMHSAKSWASAGKRFELPLTDW